MKKTVLLIMAYMAGTMMMAQSSGNGFLLSGGVIYEQITKLDIQLEGDAAQFAHALPKERKSEKILHFSKQAALYENHHVEDTEEAMDMDGHGSMMIKMVEPEYKVFTDLKNNLQIEQKEFMSRLFIIETELDKGAWKLTGQQKTILEYPCQEAVTKEEDKLVQVWFTPNIAVPAGPGKYGNLPGLVLEVDINEGENVIQARSIELKEIDPKLMKKPAKGKKVTEEEYQAIVAEKMKEMGAEHEGGSGHAVVVKIRH